MFRLSDQEASTLLGATLMHWGVPFRFAAKRALTDDQQTIVDQAAEKLVACRAAGQTSLAADLTASEMALLAQVVDNCLEECGADAVELRLQLNTGERHEVVALLDRLRSSLNAIVQPVHH